MRFCKMPLEIFTLAEGFDGVFARKTDSRDDSVCFITANCPNQRGEEAENGARKKRQCEKVFWSTIAERVCVRKHVTLFQVNQSPLYLVRGSGRR